MFWTVALGGIAVALVCAATYDKAQRAMAQYRQAYTDRADTTLGELFLFTSPRRLWPMAIFAAGVSATLVWWVTRTPLLAILSAVLTMRLPAQIMGYLRVKRLRQLDRQLPDAVRAMAGGLRAGASLASVLRHVAHSVAAPLAQELALVLRQQRLGLGFNESMRELELRVGSDAFTLFAVSLRVGGHTGGHLADTLDQVAQTMQRRIQADSRMRTLTSQGRIQALIVGALPVVLLLALNVVSPEAMAPLRHTPIGWGVLALLATLEFAGFWMISRIVRVDF